MQNISFEMIATPGEGGLGLITINRPKALNALNTETLSELLTLLNGAAKAAKVLIVTGAGEKAFVAGADIEEMAAMDHIDMLHLTDLGHQVMRKLETMPAVTIAAVNGFALGGGLELALACDFIYASEKAKLGLPEVSLGLIPGFGGTQRLARAIGTRRAKEMVFSAKIIKVDEALRMGIVNKICSPETLLDTCKELAQTIAKNSFFAVTQAKRAINFGSEAALDEGLELEKHACATSFATEDRSEGMRAFLDKRPAVFKT